MQNSKKGIDVDAILKEMAGTRNQVALEIIGERIPPLILKEDDNVSLEELIAELEETEDIIFNI